MTPPIALRREVLAARPAPTWKPTGPSSALPLGGFGGALIAVLLTTIAVSSPRHEHYCTESDADITRMRIEDYTESAYVMWLRNTEDRICPRDLAELNEYTNRHRTYDTTDAWGSQLRMSCNSHGLRVWSLGEDGRPETADDLRSWD